MFVAENFLRSLVDKYDTNAVYTDGGTWYPQACTLLHLKHRLHSPLEKNLIERVVHYFKDRTECFDDYYPCCTNNQKKKRNCDQEYVHNWIKLFVYFYNSEIRNKISFIKRGGETNLS
jgi:putative transposase